VNLILEIGYAGSDRARTMHQELFSDPDEVEMNQIIFVYFNFVILIYKFKTFYSQKAL